MSSALASQLDLDQAWKRAKLDQSQGSVFAVHPLLQDLIDADTEAWLSTLRESIASETYAPSACGLCFVPKPNGATRPGAVLSPNDHVVYTALVAAARPAIQATLNWGTPPPDFAYRPKQDISDKDWFQPHFPLWKAFDSKSIDYIESGREWVVVADIAGYYENIDLFFLRSDLNALDIHESVVRLLNQCLNRWARVQRRAIPQGFSASSLLGKLYLNSVDRSLFAKGFRHIRWVDDYRIFCHSEAEAKQALVCLIELLGARGLVVQSAKTSILSKEQSTAQFKAVHSLIEPIKKDFVQELVKAGALKNPYATASDIDHAIKELGDDVPLEVVHRAYEEHVVSEGSGFNKTLFRFLLRRLGSASDEFAVEHALTMLSKRPDETHTILAYASSVDAVLQAEAGYIAVVNQGQAVYEYQSYQVLSWRFLQDAQPCDEFMAWARVMSLDHGYSWLVRAPARMVLGRWGSADDMEGLQNRYAAATSDIERAEIICSIARMEKSRRNAFLGHAAADGDFPSRAAKFVREGRLS